MLSSFRNWWNRRKRTTIATSSYRGTQVRGLARETKLLHVVVFQLDGYARRSVRYENHGSNHHYHTELNEEVSQWINLGRLPSDAVLADNERAAQFKLFWG